MTELTKDEVLVVRVAVATCFAASVDSAGTPAADLDRSVADLIALHEIKPQAPTHAGEGLPQDLESTLAFCAGRLEEVAPDHAARLRSAVSGS